jgi:hypothetical protein
MFSLIPLLDVKIMHLVERIYLIKISNLVLGGKALVTSLYSSLERRGTETEREREKTRMTRAGVDMSYDTGNITYMRVHRNNVFKIFNFNS